ncbi:DUF4011 domain-containing protein [Stieleria sp. TO1_6]|uniref:DUF4011 domain-containing protein n=1 Tax=Stieleria tagensis TaxID=2956795 RepID=UPI00209B3233|nr:DUF4011 domain-containing protein [Stieleria tagensis]MCO8120698.1 DUF4011 domain-containing protein [Stieleria tagensis]
MRPASQKPSSPLAEEDDETSDTVRPIQIQIDSAGCVNYASYQNSSPLLRNLAITNNSNDSLSDLRLELSSAPGFVQPKVWQIDRIDSETTITLPTGDIRLDPGYLDALNEAEQGCLQIRLYDQDRLIGDAQHDLRVLARDEWGGVGAMGELLSAFVQPNDPAINLLLKSASDILVDHGRSGALDGYRCNDPSRVYLLASALWSAVADRGLSYASPPKSFERVGQKTRRPSTVLDAGLATCLDSTLLLAAALEAMGLHPIIVLKRDHCFVGVWMIESSFGRLIETDCSEVRKAIAGKELIVFETTLLTHRPAARFDDAIKVAASNLDVEEQPQFVAAIDVARARMVKIRPLASHHRPDSDTSNDAQIRSHGLDLPVNDPGPRPLPPETKPTTPDGRIDRWHRKLLDLTLRNRLLHFRWTKQTIPFVCPEVSKLEDRLSQGKRLRVVSLPDANVTAGRDAEHHRTTQHEDLESEYASAALERGEVCATLGGEDLAKRLTALYRSSRNDLAEGGSNTLFLAVGFLIWKEHPSDTRTLRAPLLLVPVKLIRKSANSLYQLAHHEDDVRFNATLIQKLKRDFDCDLSQFENELPTDKTGVDVPQVLDSVRRLVREIPGFEVIAETALSRFSFSKYLMWKDLVDRSDQLEQNRVVRHLVRDPDKPFLAAVDTAIVAPAEIDGRYDPVDLVHPLDADSTQLAAVMAAAEGHDFVLVGPPGTGKSQTIANMIAQCLAAGKTVLFVAEKTAALDVVQRRLHQHGLGDFCVELHSNKAERKRFLRQLDQAWQNGRPDQNGDPQDDWIQINAELKLRRDQLNEYVNAVHQRAANGWTPYQAMGVSIQGQSIDTPSLHWNDPNEHDLQQFQQLVTVVGDVARNFDAVRDLDPLTAITHTEWSIQWERDLLQQCDRLAETISSFGPHLTQFCDSIGLQCDDAPAEQLGHLYQLARELVDTAGEDYRTVFDPQLAQLPADLSDLKQAITRYDAAASACGATIDDDVLRQLPIDQMDRDWRDASASIWPLSALRRHKLQKRMQRFANLGVLDPANDLQLVREMQQQMARIDANPLARRDHLWQHRKTPIAATDRHLRRCQSIEKLIQEIGRSIAGSESQVSALRDRLTLRLEGLSTESALDSIARRFVASYEEYDASAGLFEHLAGDKASPRDSLTALADASEMVQRIQSNRTGLQRWTLWQTVHQRSIELGLGPFSNAIQCGAVSTESAVERFRLAYVRWWLPLVIDSSDVLRRFQRLQHEHVIAEFDQFDSAARGAAADRVRQSIAHRLPAQSDVPRKSELGMLRHQIGLKRPSKSIRSLISLMPQHFASLAPCLLMSPLSIAQYLPADQPAFDVVIFDEASQITTWDAIGAIARGRQTIIVGDPKQLPPTNFFDGGDDDEDDEELLDYERDLESILDEAKASGLPLLQLNWHYRSRHESLIAFSNHHYYDDQLVTFPSPETSDSAVSLRHLPQTHYDRGKTRTNEMEAQAIVAEAINRMKAWLQLPAEQRKTLGIVTFNSQQQTLILDLLDEAQRESPEIGWFFDEQRIEPTVVKNLENVQGDERDLMLFSITFGPDASGKVPLTFGALNREGGERRLNVAITRAREELIVFSSFTADQLDAERSKSRGVQDLKHFLAFAESDSVANFDPAHPAAEEIGSQFVAAMAQRLKRMGWDVAEQIGASGFRIPLAIRHPDDSQRFLAGIECDGLAYHRSQNARDRDKTRATVLEQLGWTMLRVWSRDWWYDPEGAASELDHQLTELLRG